MVLASKALRLCIVATIGLQEGNNTAFDGARLEPMVYDPSPVIFGPSALPSR